MTWNVLLNDILYFIDFFKEIKYLFFENLKYIIKEIWKIFIFGILLAFKETLKSILAIVICQIIETFINKRSECMKKNDEESQIFLTKTPSPGTNDNETHYNIQNNIYVSEQIDANQAHKMDTAYGAAITVIGGSSMVSPNASPTSRVVAGGSAAIGAYLSTSNLNEEEIKKYEEDKYE